MQLNLTDMFTLQSADKLKISINGKAPKALCALKLTHFNSVGHKNKLYRGVDYKYLLTVTGGEEAYRVVYIDMSALRAEPAGKLRIGRSCENKRNEPVNRAYQRTFELSLAHFYSEAFLALAPKKGLVRS